VNTKDNNSSISEGQVENLNRQWQEKIVNYLPQDLEETAKKYGVITRKRGIQSAVDLLRVMFIYVTSELSFNMLALCACRLNISEMSDTAWRKKFNSCTLWLTYILFATLPNIKTVNLKPKGSRNIHLIDASDIRRIGKDSYIARMHMSYCLNMGVVDEVTVTDNHKAEGFQNFTIQENDIYIADAGYSRATMVEYITKRKADCIIRMTPSTIILDDVNGSHIDMFKELKSSIKDKFEIHCYTRKRGNTNRIPVRIVCSKLPEDKIEKAIKKKKQTSRRKQNTIKEETLLYAEWVIIITTLDNSYSMEEILSIYRSRWQVELLFKRIKQHFKLHSIKKSSDSYTKVLILLTLIIWTLVERQVILVEIYLINKKVDPNRISIWLLSSYYYKNIADVINSMWTLAINDLDENNKLLEKYLLNHKRNQEKRESQYAKYHLDYDFNEKWTICFVLLEDAA